MSDPQPSGSQIGSSGASLQGYLAARPGQVLYAEVSRSGTAGGGADVRRRWARLGAPAARGAGLRHRRPKGPLLRPVGEIGRWGQRCAHVL